MLCQIIGRCPPLPIRISQRLGYIGKPSLEPQSHLSQRDDPSLNQKLVSKGGGVLYSQQQETAYKRLRTAIAIRKIGEGFVESETEASAIVEGPRM